MSFGDKAKQVIAAVAPMVGTALGGPFGAMAGGLVAKWLGKDGQPADTQAVEAAIATGDPEILLKLKNAENEFKEHMATLGIQEQQLRYADTANAREREVKTGDWTPRILAAMVVIAWGLIQAYLMTHVIDQSMRELIARVLGTVDSALMLILGYYFGSSVGSRNNQEALAQIAKS